jgi:transcription elongation factor GreA
MNEKEYLTQEKFDEFKKELEHLKGEKRKEVAEALEYAKALGDLSENAEYHEARDEQGTVEDRIAKLESILKTAVIVKEHDTNLVNVGSILTVEKEGKKFHFTIVGTEESDVPGGKISIKSPFGQAAIGKKKGETFSYEAPSGSISYKLVEIK